LLANHLVRVFPLHGVTSATGYNFKLNSVAILFAQPAVDKIFIASLKQILLLTTGSQQDTCLVSASEREREKESARDR